MGGALATDAAQRQLLCRPSDSRCTSEKLVQLEYRIPCDLLVNRPFVCFKSRHTRISTAYFRAATLPDVPKALPKVRQRLLASRIHKRSRGATRELLHIVKTHFRHAPESHACLSEVGKHSAAVHLSTTPHRPAHFLHQAPIPADRHTDRSRKLDTASHALDSGLSAVVDFSRNTFANHPTTCRVTSRTMRRWRAEVGHASFHP